MSPDIDSLPLSPMQMLPWISPAGPVMATFPPSLKMEQKFGPVAIGPSNGFAKGQVLPGVGVTVGAGVTVDVGVEVAVGVEVVVGVGVRVGVAVGDAVESGSASMSVGAWVH